MITNTAASSTYIITEGVTEYPVGFLYDFNPDSTPQLVVYVNKLYDTPLEYGVDYELSEDGLKVVLLTAQEALARLDIVRNIPLVQLSDYNIGRIDPEQIERDFDLAVERDQQIRAGINILAELPLDHEAKINQNTRDIAAINSLIPTQASTTNQLADKAFVNSSIATATAAFKGTFDTLAELTAVTADNNDYGFVVGTDAAGNTVYNRYKFNGTTWEFEYALNNSSFTSEQWAAINSGITAELVSHIIGPESLLQTIYPVGSIYIGTTATCPIAVLFGTWELVAADRVLQGSSESHLAGTTIEAGLPDHTHTVSSYASVYTFSGGTYGGLTAYTDRTTSAASESNPIYGNSTTVQPPAYVVNIWRRTA
jgi:hypothetical protein